MVKHIWSVFGLLSAIVVSVRGNIFARPLTFNLTGENIPIKTITEYGTNFYWILPYPYTMKLDQMFNIALFGDFRVDGLTVFGIKAIDLPTKYQCYYFAPVAQTDLNCRRKAEEDDCAYIATQTFKVTYKSKDNANFGIRYAYASCSDRGSSTPIWTTTTTTTSTTVNMSVIDGRRKHPKQDSTTDSSVISEIPTTRHNNGQGDQTTLIIAVAVAAVLFVIIILILLFCGIRFSRNRGKSKEQESSIHQSPIAPSPDALYEEILPVLPARNPNMQDHGYEVPISTNDGAAMHTNNNADYVTIQNELYHVTDSAKENNESPRLENKNYSDESSAGSEHLNEKEEHSVASVVDNMLYQT